ncbi:MAG: metallophosphoesterase [Bacteroidaceae bacterium]|nr:metallophosphoesterase [Bacteroidaceae bacterium]
MLFRILFLLFILIIVPDVYIYFRYVRRWTCHWLWRALTFLPTILLLLYMLLVLHHDDMRVEHQPVIGLFMFIFLLYTVPRMLFTLLDLMGWLVFPRIVRITAMTVALFSCILLCYGYFIGRNRFVVHQQTFYFPNLPKEFDGYRIAHFSDLHIGTFSDGHQSDVTDIVNLINHQKCDAILFTGDLVNYESRETDGYKQVLGSLKASDGVYAVMGNHDYSMYIPAAQAVRDADIQELQRREQSYGWTLLLNDNVVIHHGSDSIAIVGSENDGTGRFPALGDLPRATAGLIHVMRNDTATYFIPADSDTVAVRTADHTFSILMSHDPTHWRRHVIPDTHIDLTLAGHTHAGQFKVFGWSPVAFVYDEWSGAYSEGNQILNVSDGVGQVMFPFRFGAWPEINIITLKRP